MSDPQHGPRRILRKREAEKRSGLSDTSLWRRVRDGTFPAPVKLGPYFNSPIGWYEDEFEASLAARPRVSYAATQPGPAPQPKAS